MKFKYKVQSKNNEIVEGVIESPDRFTLARELREKGEIPISIEEVKKEGGLFSKKMRLFGKIKLSEKIMFTNNLSGMLSAGLSINRALTILEKQSTNPTFTEVLKGLEEDINKGNTLSEGMKRFPKIFSGIFVPMVHAGEESGSLPKTLTEVGTTLKKTYDLNKKIKGAMTYPTIVLVAMLGIGTLLIIYVVPTLTATFKDIGTELPTSTKAIIWLSDTLSQHTIALLFIIIGLVVAGILLSKVKKVQRWFDRFILYIPVVGLLVK